MPKIHHNHGHTHTCCHGEICNYGPRWLNNWAALHGMWVHQSLVQPGSYYISPILPEGHLVMESANGYIHCNKRISRVRFIRDFAHWG